MALLCAGAPAAPWSGAPENDIEHNARLQQEFTLFNPRFQELKAERVAILRTLAAKVEEREAARQSTACSHQILWELKLLVGLSADFRAIDRRIQDLQTSLSHPEREASAEVQNPEDGSWGGCYEAWHLKLMASYDHRADRGARPFRFLDRINAPEKLTAYLDSIATSNIAQSGVDHTYELNECLSDLTRLILRGQPQDYPWHPLEKETLMDLLLHRFRNPDTGWWGERYVRDGRVRFVDDLSMTFHTVSYLDGNVPDLPKIVDTALALKGVDTPAGRLALARRILEPQQHGRSGAVSFRLASGEPVTTPGDESGTRKDVALVPGRIVAAGRIVPTDSSGLISRRSQLLRRDVPGPDRLFRSHQTVLDRCRLPRFGRRTKENRQSRESARQYRWRWGSLLQEHSRRTEIGALSRSAAGIVLS
jgi:hypothetical protein